MKKDTDLFSIGEVAQAVGVTRRIILNYEDRGLIHPDVKDSSSGNRYYTIDTFVKIRTIRIFQNLGLSLTEIQRYFSNRHIEKLKERSNASPPEVKTVLLPQQCVYCRVCPAPTVAERTTLLRKAALDGMRLYGTDITQRMYLVESRLDRPEEISFCVAVPPESRGEGIRILPAAQALSVYHHGAYETLYTAVEQLIGYAREHGLRHTGVIRRIYLEGPPQHKDPDKFITQVVLPLAE